MKKPESSKMLIHGFIMVTILATARSAEAEMTMEAAFQGHCGHTSPCEQLCYEIHDGMYECDCIEGYELSRNGYSCQVINSTSSSGGDGHSKSDEDVLYQKGASFSAKLGNANERDNQISPSTSFAAAASASSSSGSEEDTDDTDIFFDDELMARLSQQQQQQQQQKKQQLQQQQQQQQQYVNSKNYDISAQSIHFSNNRQDFDTINYNDVPEFGAKLEVNSQQQQQQQQQKQQQQQPQDQRQQQSSHQIITTIKPYKNKNKSKNSSGHHKKHHSRARIAKTSSPTIVTSLSPIHNSSNISSISSSTSTAPKLFNAQAINTNNNNNNMEYDFYMKPDLSVYDDVNNNQLNLRPLSPNTYQSQNTYNFDSNTLSITNDNHNHNQYEGDVVDTTTTEGRVTVTMKGITVESENISNINESQNRLENSSEPCNLNCGLDGTCDDSEGRNRCLCPFGKTGNSCVEDIKVRMPKFSRKSWLAFPALRGAYKHVQIRIEFRPESFDGIILLSGERDDLTGDFMALLLNKGFVEFWFDCGSGVGSVRSKETILLNEWNSVIIYRHRWDAWLVLNHGTRVQGRSNGLFSRITFREPVFLGGTGNITGLAKRLPVSAGFLGCIRRFVANEHEYKFEEYPLGDVSKGFDIQDCVTDKCFKYPCQHGGKCLPSDQGAVCLCPMGFVGDLCEIRMDLQVPAFNGTSFLRYAPLGDSALIWLELKIILKPEHPDGIILFSGPQHKGDFIALSLNNGFVEFALELGSGPAVVRSEHPLNIGQWHTIKVSRTARLAVLKIDDSSEVMTISSNGFWHLSLPHNLFLGGVNHVDNLPLDLKYHPFFVGCIQKIEINGHALSIVSEALGGTNIGNCPHACVARPCGPLAQCVPQMEGYECRCGAFNDQCNKAAQSPFDRVGPSKIKKLKNPKNLDHHSNRKQESKMAPQYKEGKISYKSKKMLETPIIRQHLSNNDNDDIIVRDVHAMRRKPIHQESNGDTKYHDRKIQRKPKMEPISKAQHKDHSHLHHGVKDDSHHKHGVTEQRKLSRLPTHYERFQTNPESDILTFDNIQEDSDFRKQEVNDEEAWYQDDNDWGWSGEDDDHQLALESSELNENPLLLLDETKLFDESDEAHKKQFAQDMKRIMGNSQVHPKKITAHHDDQHYGVDDGDGQKDHGNVGDFGSDHLNYADHIDHIDYDDQNDHIITGDQVDQVDAADRDDHIVIDDAIDHVNQVEAAARNDHIALSDHGDHNAADSLGNHDSRRDHQAAPDHITDDNDDLLEAVESSDEKPSTQPHTDWSVLGRFDLTGIDHQIGVKKNFGACFSGSDSYFHYNDAETMSQIISYNIDLNLRIKTHSRNGVIIWTGRQSATEEDDDFLSLGIENGYLHFRYDLGSGDVDIHFNGTKISDGLWHRVRAMRNSQDGYLEVDGRKSSVLRSPGRLRQLNTDAGLFVGGMPDVSYYTRRKYSSGIVGCISEIVLAGQLKLNFDPNTLGAAHNVETGIL